MTLIKKTLIFLLIALWCATGVYIYKFYVIAKPKELRIAYLERGKFWIYEEYKKVFVNEFPNLEIVTGDWSDIDGLNKKAFMLMQRKNIDAIVSCGSDAAKALAMYNNYVTKVYCVGVSSPLDVGLMKACDKPKYNNFFLRHLPNRTIRQLKFFKNFFNFKKLGIICVANMEYVDFCSFHDVYNMSKELGFEVVKCETTAKEATQDCLDCFNQFVIKKVDAVFLPQLACFDDTNIETQLIKDMLDVLTRNKIYTFAKDGNYMAVKHGALIGFEFPNYVKVAKDWVRRIKENKDVADTTVCNDFDFVLNMETAKKLDFKPDAGILRLSRKIYEK